MFKDSEKQYQLYQVMLTAFLTFGLTLAMNEYYGLQVHFILCAIISLTLSMMVYLFDCNRNNVISYLVLFSFIPVLTLFFWLRKINPLEGVSNIIQWIQIYDGSEVLYNSLYAHIITLITVIILSVICYLCMKNQITKLIIAGALGIAFVFFSIINFNLSKIMIGAGLFYIIINIVELYGMIYSKKIGKKEKKTGILYLSPVCFIVVILSVTMPSKPEPFEWSGAKHIYRLLSESITNIIDEIDYRFVNRGSKFSLALVGYTEYSGNLGGGRLEEDDTVVLKTVTGTRSTAPVYLSGSVSNVYTGSRWENNTDRLDERASDYIIDFIEFMYALSRQEFDLLENERFVESRILHIEHRNIRTRSIFYPLKSSRFRFNLTDGRPDMESTNILLQRPVKEGDSYQIDYYEMNLKSEVFQDMLRRESSFSYDDKEYLEGQNRQWVRRNIFTIARINNLLNEWDFYEILRDRARYIKEEYTGLPDSLPERVRELAFKITEYEDNDYDKLRALEAFLNTYKYSRYPGQVPNDVDFVDYFLFEQKEGYCTSFATAMAVLARCIGIPTRYVEGFVLDYKENPEYSTYLIRSNQAHSWVEAYIEGVGWIPFEATPSYYESRYVAWQDKPKPNGEGIIDPPSYLYDRNQAEEIIESVSNVRPKLPQEEEHINKAFVGSIIAFSTTIILILMFFVYYKVLRYKYKKSYSKADNNKKMYRLFLRILMFLKWEGFLMNKDETIRMLANRVNTKYCYDRITFFDVAEIYMRFRYAESIITEEELSKIEKYHEGLELKQWEERGKLRMYFHEFLFLMKKGNYS